MLPAIDTILIFGLIMLTCGSAGLWVVRLNNPLLRGVGWLGGALAAGGGGAVLLLLDTKVNSIFNTVLADLLVLLAFVLLHVVILEMADSASIFPVFGAWLLVTQAGVDLWVTQEHHHGGLRVTVVSVLIAAQTGQTAWRLLQERNLGVRAPAWFTGFIMASFALFNAVRAILTGCGWLQSRIVLRHEVQTLSFALFIAVALGIAFGLFWMTTTMRSSGLEHMASTDPLTRIYNRRVFLLWCEKELVRSERGGMPFSILMIDMDHFKKINDRFGHRTGDIALCTAVEKMQDSIRGIDVLGRWGGEEFVALLPHASPDAALVVAERLRGNVAQTVLPAPKPKDGTVPQPLRLTVSVGVATYAGEGDDLQHMLQRADESLYKAKAAGRNRVLAMPAWSQQRAVTEARA